MSRLKFRRAFSWMEAMIFMALAILIGAVASELYVKGVSLSDETHKSVMIQQDIRAVVENITRDMNGAYWVLNSAKGYEHSLILIKYGSANTEERLGLNIASNEQRFDYPFSRSGEEIKNYIDAYKVTYEYEENEQLVYRTEEKGVFTIGSQANQSSVATEYSFAATDNEGLMDKQVIAENVKQFDLHYFGYETDPQDARGALKEVWDLKFTESASDDVKIGMTACILLRVMANFKEGLYKDGGNHRSPETAILTKIWSNSRLRDEMYKEYFSSTDWNFQF